TSRGTRTPSRMVARAFCLVATGCAGKIGAVGGDPIAHSEGSQPGVGAGPGAASVAPGPLLLRRLTNAEDRNTVRDPPGAPSDVTKDFPADPYTNGFDNAADTLTISSVHAEHYRDAAETLTADVLASPARRATVLGCDLGGAGRAGCLRSFIEHFG